MQQNFWSSCCVSLYQISLPYCDSAILALSLMRSERSQEVVGRAQADVRDFCLTGSWIELEAKVCEKTRLASEIDQMLRLAKAV